MQDAHIVPLWPDGSPHNPTDPAERPRLEVYLPEGRWTSVFDGSVEEGGRWLRQQHGVMTLPLYVREGAELGIDPAALGG